MAIDNGKDSKFVALDISAPIVDFFRDLLFVFHVFSHWTFFYRTFIRQNHCYLHCRHRR